MGILSTPARLCVYTHTISKQLITYGTQDVTSTVERPLDVNGVPSRPQHALLLRGTLVSVGPWGI